MDNDVVSLQSTALVPIIVTLAQDALAAAEAPPPLYLTIPRSSSFAAVWEPMHKHFLPFTAACFESAAGMPMWVEHRPCPDGEGIPIPWQYPVGALADRSAAFLPSTAPVVPLSIVAHSGLPPKKSCVVPVSCEKDAQVIVQQQLKASLTVLYEDTKPFYQLPLPKTMALVNFALCHDATTLSKLKTQVREAIEELGRHGGEEVGWPATVHVVKVQPTSSMYPVIQSVRTYPVAIACKENSTATFNDLLVQAFGADIIDASTNIVAAGSTAPDECLRHGKIRRVLCDGVEPFLSTPISFLMKHCVSSDRALHLVVTME